MTLVDSAPAPTPTHLADLAGLTGNPHRTLLAFDYDGTLAPAALDIDNAVIGTGWPAMLTRLVAAGYRTAIISGRSVAALRRLAGPRAAAALDRMDLFGQYGLEHYDPRTGRTAIVPSLPALERARALLHPALLGAGLLERVVVDDKGAILAVYVKAADEAGAITAELRHAVAELAADPVLVLEEGHRYVELRPARIDKGAAIRTLVRAHKPDAVLYAGDSVPDLAAFAAVHRARATGEIRNAVNIRTRPVPELSAAVDCTVDGPVGLLDLLGPLCAT